MNLDISGVLEGFEFKADPPNVRRILGDDGRPKIQMRLDLGLLQMEAEGRPDGQRPHGHDCLLDYYTAQLHAHERHHGSEQGFQLSADDCASLRQEALQYYHRYLGFLLLDDWTGLARDTAHNLRVFDLIRTYAASDEDRWSTEQFRPYVLMMHTRGRASQALRNQDYNSALAAIEQGIQAIEAFFRQHNREELIPECQELTFLHDWAERIKENKPLSRMERLQRDLQAAVQNEEYERAAKLRDEIRRLGTRERGPARME
jgi:hypothetical protein